MHDPALDASAVLPALPGGLTNIGAPFGGGGRALEPRLRQLAWQAAAAILDAFDQYQTRFRAITRRSQERFESREWQQWQADSIERLDLYEQVLRSVVAGVQTLLGSEVHNKPLWHAVKLTYARLLGLRKDMEVGETFYNSVTRRILITVGVEPELEFVWFGATTLPTGDTPIVRLYVQVSTLRAMIKSILQDYQLGIPFADLDGDAARVAAVLEDQLRTLWDSQDVDCIEMVKPVFYRNKAAYLVGRIRKRNRVIPIIMPLLNDDGGLFVDTVLLSEAEASVVCSFTRSYFHVDADIPGDLVGFLKSIMPFKPVAELYIAIGYNKHGKTERYRALYRHLSHSNDKFEIARGAKGMVLTVFTLPSYDVVF